ncbi:MAG: membrane protein insertion efficiency factor YidD [Stenomitos rutilans HA7619-LM2]|nr:membrane protein insertion efficiency factor YidD [Stenomitos rutilans HA7619-LM2]
MELIRDYQTLLPPWLPPACRFQPTCSQYALEAVDRCGTSHGRWLLVWCFCRDRPLHSSG